MDIPLPPGNICCCLAESSRHRTYSVGFPCVMIATTQGMPLAAASLADSTKRNATARSLSARFRIILLPNRHFIVRVRTAKCLHVGETKAIVDTLHTAPLYPTKPSSRAQRTLVPNFGTGAVAQVEEICKKRIKEKNRHRRAERKWLIIDLRTNSDQKG